LFPVNWSRMTRVAAIVNRLVSALAALASEQGPCNQHFQVRPKALNDWY